MSDLKRNDRLISLSVNGKRLKLAVSLLLVYNDHMRTSDRTPEYFAYMFPIPCYMFPIPCYIFVKGRPRRGSRWLFTSLLELLYNQDNDIQARLAYSRMGTRDATKIPKHSNLHGKSLILIHVVKSQRSENICIDCLF